MKLNDLKNISIRDYYINTYPNDSWGYDLKHNTNFKGLYRNITDVYEYIGVGDSVIRERLFTKLSELLNVDYDFIYYKWLGNEEKIKEKKVKEKLES